MSNYTTETGFYVIVDGEGRVLARADVPVGTHPTPEAADPSKTYDVDSQSDLDAVEIDPHYATE